VCCHALDIYNCFTFFCGKTYQHVLWTPKWRACLKHFQLIPKHIPILWDYSITPVISSNRNISNYVTSQSSRSWTFLMSRTLKRQLLENKRKYSSIFEIISTSVQYEIHLFAPEKMFLESCYSHIIHSKEVYRGVMIFSRQPLSLKGMFRNSPASSFPKIHRRTP
jgi:hypothetical protein